MDSPLYLKYFSGLSSGLDKYNFAPFTPILNNVAKIIFTACVSDHTTFV